MPRCKENSKENAKETSKDNAKEKPKENANEKSKENSVAWAGPDKGEAMEAVVTRQPTWLE